MMIVSDRIARVFNMSGATQALDRITILNIMEFQVKTQRTLLNCIGCVNP